MDLLLVGLSHHTAPLSVRERLVLTDDRLELLLSAFSASRQRRQSPRELAWLSTCNRVELVAYGDPQELESLLVTYLSGLGGLSEGDLRAHLYLLRGDRAARHLLRVACGLDSMVVGEPQILGQVTEAYEAALRHGTVGPVLSRLFQAAIHAGKRARAETRIAREASSLSAVAVRLATQVVGDLRSARVLVLGAGEMATLAVQALARRGARDLVVLNRSLTRARRLAAAWGGRAGTLGSLEAELAEADVVITSTGAPQPLITRAQLASLLRRRPTRPLVILDIAVPRDVDPAAADLPGLTLFDLDGLHRRFTASRQQRLRDVPRVERILEEELRAFLDWYRGLEVHYLLRALHTRAEELRQRELERTLRRLPGLTPQERDRLEALTRALVRKLLHAPSVRLRARAREGKTDLYAQVAGDLFGLPEEIWANGREEGA